VLARAFGMEVLAWGPTLTAERAARSEAELLELDALLQAADVVTVHLRLSDESRGLLDERRLRLMRAHAVFINTARGAIVDEKALARLLEEGAIAGAASTS
jgi:phosphoglycerate dehydrogenase-like enzyme